MKQAFLEMAAQFKTRKITLTMDMLTYIGKNSTIDSYTKKYEEIMTVIRGISLMHCGQPENSLKTTKRESVGCIYTCTYINIHTYIHTYRYLHVSNNNNKRKRAYHVWEGIRC